MATKAPSRMVQVSFEVSDHSPEYWEMGVISVRGPRAEAEQFAQWLAGRFKMDAGGVRVIADQAPKREA